MAFTKIINLLIPSTILLVMGDNQSKILLLKKTALYFSVYLHGPILNNFCQEFQI